MGSLGGLSGSAALGAPPFLGLGVGALFGLAFGLFFARRATSPGAGLIWGLSCAFLAWLMIPAGLRGAREHFPELVACLLCLGMPVGVALGHSRKLPQPRRPAGVSPA